MGSQFSWTRSLAAGLGLSLLGGVLAVLVLWLKPAFWGERWAGLFGLVVLAFVPGMARVIPLWRAHRHRKAWVTLAGCILGVVLLALLGVLLVLILAGQAMPRHD